MSSSVSNAQVSGSVEGTAESQAYVEKVAKKRAKAEKSMAELRDRFNDDPSKMDPNDYDVRSGRYSGNLNRRKRLMVNGVFANHRERRTGIKTVPPTCGPVSTRYKDGKIQCRRKQDVDYLELEDEDEPPTKMKRLTDGLAPKYGFCPCHDCVMGSILISQSERGFKKEVLHGPEGDIVEREKKLKYYTNERDRKRVSEQVFHPLFEIDDMEKNELRDSCQVCCKYVGLNPPADEAQMVYVSVRRAVRGYRYPVVRGEAGSVTITAGWSSVNPEDIKPLECPSSLRTEYRTLNELFPYHFFGGAPLPVCNGCMKELIDPKDCAVCQKVGVPSDLLPGYPIKCLPREVSLSHYRKDWQFEIE